MKILLFGRTHWVPNSNNCKFQLCVKVFHEGFCCVKTTLQSVILSRHARLILKNHHCALTYEKKVAGLRLWSEFGDRNEVVVTLDDVVLPRRTAAMWCQARTNPRTFNYSRIGLTILFVHNYVNDGVDARREIQQKRAHDVPPCNIERHSNTDLFKWYTEHIQWSWCKVWVYVSSVCEFKLIWIFFASNMIPVRI